MNKLFKPFRRRQGNTEKRAYKKWFYIQIKPNNVIILLDFCICSHIAHKSHSVCISHARKFVWLKKRVVNARITSSDLFSYAINKTHFRLMTSAIVCIFMKNSHADSVSNRTFVIYQCCCQKCVVCDHFLFPRHNLFKIIELQQNKNAYDGKIYTRTSIYIVGDFFFSYSNQLHIFHSRMLW